MLIKLGFVLCGVALCGTTYALVQQHRQIQALTLLVGEPARAVVDGKPASSPQPALVTRVQQLEAQMGDFGQASRSARVVRGNERPERAVEPPAPRAESTTRPAAAPASERAVLDLLESDDPQVRERFRAVVQAEQERLSDERREQWQARNAERSRQRVSELATRVRLSDEQENTLNDALDAEREKASDLFAQAREDQDFGDVRGKVRQLRDTTDEAVKTQLNGEQFSAYQEMRAEDRRRFGLPPDRNGPEGATPGSVNPGSVHPDPAATQRARAP